MSTKLITAIVPCYNEEEVLPLFYERICEVARRLAQAEFEFLFVNDGSKDRTLEILRALSRKDKRVRYLSFSRNFGKEAGMAAGLKEARGEYVVILDADLQHPPEFLPEMFSTLETGQFDCVGLYRKTRERGLRSALSRRFSKMIGRVSHMELRAGATDFRMMTRQVVDCILQMPEYNRFTKGIFGWVGFRTRWIGYENVERAAGKTKWSMMGLFRYAVQGITAFSTFPLTMASMMGILLCLLSVITALFHFFKALIWGDPVAGFPTLICVILFIGGVQLLCIGVLGEYMAKTYLETKRRPLYFIQETDQSQKNSEVVGNQFCHK